MGTVTAAMVNIHQSILYIFIILSIGIVVSFLLLRHSSKCREKKLNEKYASLYELGQKVSNQH